MARRGRAQSASLLTKMPRRPPASVTTALVSGTSGRAGKLMRRRPPGARRCGRGGGSGAPRRGGRRADRGGDGSGRAGRPGPRGGDRGAGSRDARSRPERHEDSARQAAVARRGRGGAVMSSSSPSGRVRVAAAMPASSAPERRTARRAGWPLRARPPERERARLGLKPSALQLPPGSGWSGWSWRRRCCGWWFPPPAASQLVGLQGEVRAVEPDVDRAQPQRHAVEDLREGIGDDVALGGFGVDEEGVSDDHGAEVEGAGHRRGDDRHRQRGAFVGAGEVGVAVGVEGVGARAGADGDRADPGGGGQDGDGLLGGAALGGGGRQCGLGAVGDADELGGEALGQGRFQGAQFLFAVGAGDVEGEGAGGAGGAVRCRRSASGRRGGLPG